MDKEKILKAAQAIVIAIAILGVVYIMAWGLAKTDHFARPTVIYLESPGCNATLCGPIEAEVMKDADALGIGFKKLAISDYVEFPIVYVLTDTRMSSLYPLQTEYMIGNFLCEEIKTDAACALVETPKADVPEVQLFVMSLCPYGLQMEKGLAPVLALLEDDINFHLRFVNYSLHGDKELVENMIEFCIREMNESNIVPYMNCYSQNGNTAYCVNYAGADATLIEGCFANVEDRLHIRANAINKSVGDFPIDANLNWKYKVRGSPTLVINGEIVNTARDPASLLKTICNSFTNPPLDCGSKLSAEVPKPGIGLGAATEGDTGACGI